MNPKETLFSKVKGTSFYNVPWMEMQSGDQLQARREPHNKYDTNAIALYFQGIQIGHIDKDVAAELAPLLDSKSATLTVFIEELTGGDTQLDFFSENGSVKEKKKQRGCNIRLELSFNDNYLNQFVEGDVIPASDAPAPERPPQVGGFF